MNVLYLSVLFMTATLGSAGILEQLKNIHVVLKTPSIPQFKPFEIRVNGLGTALGLAKNATANSTEVQSLKSELITTTTTTTSKPVTKATTASKVACGEHILLDLNLKKKETFHSIQFPDSRSAPYACSWDVQVSKSCPRAQIKMKVNPKSRLAFSSNCNRGYFRVSPFMQEAKVCGNISLVPEFKWVVDDQQPQQEAVSVIMKNIGLSDGKPEGMSFTLSGECINEKSKVQTSLQNNELAEKWLTSAGKMKNVSVFSRKALEPASKLSSKISVVGEDDDSPNGEQTEDTTTIVLSDDTAAAVASIAAAMTHDQPGKPVSVKTTKKPIGSTTAPTTKSPPTKAANKPTTKPAKRKSASTTTSTTTTTTTTVAPKTATTSAQKSTTKPDTITQTITTETAKPQRIINPFFALFRRLNWI